MKHFEFVSYGWEEVRANKGVCGFEHPDEPKVVLAFDDTSLLKRLPIVNRFAESDGWRFAVVDNEASVTIEEDYLDSRNEAFEAVQEYLEENKVQ